MDGELLENWNWEDETMLSYHLAHTSFPVWQVGFKRVDVDDMFLVT